jgi:hypothetical protein
MEEAVFIITHSIMAICGIVIICIGISLREKRVPVAEAPEMCQINQITVVEEKNEAAILLEEINSVNGLLLTAN